MTTDDSHVPASGSTPQRPLDDNPGSLLQSDFNAESPMLYDAWVMLRRRRYWVLVTFLVGIAASLIAAKISPPMFDAVSTIRIVEGGNSGIQFEDAPASSILGEDPEIKLQTEIAVLTSHTVAMRVANVLDLYRNRTFSRPGKAEGIPSAGNPLTVHRVLVAMSGVLKVEEIPHTEAISITVRTRSPQLSERIANTLVDEYAARGYQVRYESQHGISEWLARQLEDLRQQTEDAQSRALEYGKKLNLLDTMVAAPPPTASNSAGGGAQSLDTQRLLGMQQSLVAAESDMLVKEAQYNVLQNSSINSINPESDPVLAALLTARDSAMAQQKELSAKYGPNYPAVKQVNARTAQLDKQIGSELINAQTRAFTDLTVARNSVKSLKSAVDQEKQDMQQRDDDVVRYTIAERDFESSYALYQSLLQKLKEAGVLAGLKGNNVEVIDRALVPLTKAAPRTSNYLLAGSGMGLLLGCLLAVLVDALDKSILDADLLKQTIGAPTIGMIPRLRGAQPDTLQTTRRQEELDAPARQQIEAYRTLRTSLLLSHPGQPPRTIVVTSAIPEEGKSTTAINLAMIMAQGGSRVLLMECDLRRPSIGFKLSIPAAHGVSQILAGMKQPSECIHSFGDQSGVDILVAGAQPPNPAELLASPQFTALLQQMRSAYDFVILDSPPTVSVSDVQIIAAQSDGVLYVVRSGSTSRHLAQQGCRMLRRTGARILGGVLNAIDYQSDAYGYYGYYDYYSSGKSGSESKEKRHEK